MLDETAVRAGYRRIAFETLGSTNDQAVELARKGDPGKLWISAEAQTSGRGRVGRRWSSPVGNLYASLLLLDPAEPVHVPELGFVAGLALVRAVGPIAAGCGAVRIKWPNDLVHDGRKLAGILVEGTRLPHGALACVLGFGVNCRSHPTGLDYPTTDLEAVADRPVSRAELLRSLSFHIVQVLNLWDRGRNFAAVRTAWLAAALPEGSRVRINTPRSTLDGRFETIDSRGRLVVTTASGPVVIEAGDVFLTDHEQATA